MSLNVAPTEIGRTGRGVKLAPMVHKEAGLEVKGIGGLAQEACL